MRMVLVSKPLESQGIDGRLQELAQLTIYIKGDLHGTTQIVSCKSNLQLAYDCRVRHKRCRRILKHV